MGQSLARPTRLASTESRVGRKRQSNRGEETVPCSHRGSDYALASTRCGEVKGSSTDGLARLALLIPAFPLVAVTGLFALPLVALAGLFALTLVALVGFLPLTLVALGAFAVGLHQARLSPTEGAWFLGT